ncbi:FCD domain-containing protein, partial [Singulisphaera rosea]
NLRAALDEHRRILDAFVARDPKAARKQMAAHIEARLKSVLAELDRQAVEGSSMADDPAPR